MPVQIAKKRQKPGAEPKATPVLRLRIDGPGIRKGRVPIPELVRICEEAQSAINKQAEALKNRKTIHPGPAAHSIQEECTLELVAIYGNSPTILEFDLRKPQRALEFSEDFGEKAIREVGTTIKRASKRRAELDPGVMLRIYSMSGVITPKGISEIDWITASRNGHRRQVSNVITQVVRERIAKKLSSPRRAIVEIDGVLEMADFKKEDNKCRVDPPIGTPVTCTFDPAKADQIYALLRKHVRVKGEGRIRPYTDKIEALHIEEIIPLAPTELGDQSFFANTSLADLMAAGNVQPMDDLSVFAGGIPDDEDVDAMLKDIYDSRK